MPEFETIETKLDKLNDILNTINNSSSYNGDILKEIHESLNKNSIQIIDLKEDIRKIKQEQSQCTSTIRSKIRTIVAVLAVYAIVIAIEASVITAKII